MAGGGVGGGGGVESCVLAHSDKRAPVNSGAPCMQRKSSLGKGGDPSQHTWHKKLDTTIDVKESLMPQLMAINAPSQVSVNESILQCK